MHITVESILKEPIMQDAVVLAGQNGLQNTVTRVSVFDYPFRPGILNPKIISTGDLFLSGLDQFKTTPDKLSDFIQFLSDAKCSALFILDENIELITSEIVYLCNAHHFPLIAFDHDIPYAVIMDTINKLTFLQFRHAINGLYLNRILLDNLSPKEIANFLNAINPEFDNYIQVIMLKGSHQSVTNQSELVSLFSSKSNDSYIFYENRHYFIFSDDNKINLSKKIRTYKQFLPQFFTSYAMGISMLHEYSEIRTCLHESKLILDVADSLNINILEYASDSFFQLILLLKGFPELKEYYDAYLQKLNAFDSENGSILFNTMKEFVKSKGSYSDVATRMNQHENTIRYRINKIRQLFNMENDLIAFYNTIAVLSMIDAVK